MLRTCLQAAWVLFVVIFCGYRIRTLVTSSSFKRHPTLGAIMVVLELAWFGYCIWISLGGLS